MNEKLNQNIIMKALDFAYDKAVNGLPGLESAEDIAKSYLNGKGSLKDKCKKLIRWQILKAGTSGFITGLGGLLTLPVALPANLTSVLYIQLRMVAAIAYIGGNDIKSDQVKTLCYVCLCGSASTEIFKELGIQISSKLAINLIKKVPAEIILKINQMDGFRLLTKFVKQELLI